MLKTIFLIIISFFAVIGILECFLNALETTSTEYVIVDRAVGLHDYFISLGKEYKAETTNYVIYKVL